jgi:hypothetical protein
VDGPDQSAAALAALSRFVTFAVIATSGGLFNVWPTTQ